MVDNATSDAHDAVKWKWKGSQINPYDLGDPTATASYSLCLYGNGTRLLRATASAGGTCGATPCWNVIRGGFKYADKLAAGDGVTKIALKSGKPGKASIQLIGKGVNLHPPTPRLDTSVTVQLKRHDASTCWEGIFSTPTKNVAGVFAAKSD